MKKTFEYLHSDKYADAIKLAEKFTTKTTYRPILLFAKHDKDGSLVATDSHVAIQVKDIHGFKEDYLVHPHTFEFATGEYPDTEHIFDAEGLKNAIKLNKKQIKIWLQMHRSINQFVKSIYGSSRHVTIEFTKELNFRIKGEDGLSFKLPFESYKKIEGIDKINYNQEHMRNALEAHVVLGSEHVYIQLRGVMTPIVLTNKDDVKTLLTPIRTY